MAIKDNLKRIRKEKGFTQQKLASESKVSFSMVSKLESGEQENPSLETVNKLALALKVEPFELLTSIDFEKITPILEQVDKKLAEFQGQPIEIARQKIHRLLISEEGTSAFEINLAAISPEELDRVEYEIMNFVKFQFEKFKGKPSIYNSD